MRHSRHHPGMDRRRFLLTCLASVLASPLTARAQQAGRVYRIGFISPGPPPSGPSRTWDAFLHGLSQHGRIEGVNVVIERRYASGRFDRVPAFLEELVAMNCDVIVTVTTSAALHAKRIVKDIPIVMAASTDPVGAGVVNSLARPGGNITGFALTGPELTGKRLEFLKAIAPRLSKLVLATPTDHPVYALYRESAIAAAATQNLTEVRVENIGVDPEKWDEKFARMAEPQGLTVGVLVTESPSLIGERTKLAALALKYRLPSVYGVREHVEAGGLISYGVDVADLYTRTASIVARIISGTKPADIPVEQPTKFELVINANTARRLGLTIPPAILLLADQVIE
jgi:putative ABC transport system substrate-binding protein